MHQPIDMIYSVYNKPDAQVEEATQVQLTIADSMALLMKPSYWMKPTKLMQYTVLLREYAHTFILL